MVSMCGVSIAPRRINHQCQRRAASSVIPVRRRDGLRYIVTSDPHMTAFDNRDVALWLARFLG